MYQDADTYVYYFFLSKVSLFSEKTDSSNNSILKIRKEYGRLVNITSQSRKLASEGKELSNVMISKKNMTVLKQDYSPSFFFTLCRGELKDIDPKPKRKDFQVPIQFPFWHEYSHSIL